MAETSAATSSDIQSQFQGFFDNLSPGKKLSVVFAILMVLAGLGFILYNTQQETYTIFMNNMTPKESAMITSKLDTAQIKYKIQPGGNGVLVETGQLDKARLEIASSGISSANIVGFEIFDKSDFTATEFEQNIRYRRAIEGELSRLIQQIQIVDSAKVIVAIPEKSVFISQDRVPTASVQINVKSGQYLSPKASKTITNLVAGAIPNMVPQNVRISDQYGNLYSSDSQDAISAEIRDENLKYQTDFEKYLTQKVLSQLEKIAGTGHVEVRTSVDINFERSQIEENIVDPDSSTLISEETLTETAAGSRSIPVGIPGVTSNSPEIQAGSSEVANISDYNKKQKKANYENSKKFVKKTLNSGTVDKINLSVLIDNKLVSRTNEAGETVEESVRWSEEELSNIGDIAKRAVGFNEKRGDKIEVRNISFSIKKADNTVFETEQQLIEREFWINIIKYLFFSTVIIALILVVIRPMVKRLFQESDDLNLIMGLPTSVGSFEGGGAPVGDFKDKRPATDNISNLADEQAFPVELPSRNKILDLAKSDVQKTANMIKFWLKDPAAKK